MHHYLIKKQYFCLLTLCMVSLVAAITRKERVCQKGYMCFFLIGSRGTLSQLIDCYRYIIIYILKEKHAGKNQGRPKTSKQNSQRAHCFQTFISFSPSRSFKGVKQDLTHGMPHTNKYFMTHMKSSD